MKTHELARTLMELARILKEASNVELSDLSFTGTTSLIKPKVANIPMALAALTGLLPVSWIPI